MVAKRIIPCLDVKDGRTVKGINFCSLESVGDPVEMGRLYSQQGADELVYLDISATIEGRSTFLKVAERIAESINIPFTVGGGISNIYQAQDMLMAGADKISVNSAAVANPKLISDIAQKYGSQYIVVAVDIKKRGGEWEVMTHGGGKGSGRELFAWLKEVCERGAGELLITSMDHDGTKEGYPCDLYKQVSELVNIPVIASGGAGSAEHIEQVLTKGRADAALAASIFHYGQIMIPHLKEYLHDKGLIVRLK